MSVSFKKFVEFVDLETVSEEQIDEIFGVFSNNSKIEKLKAEREKLRAKLSDPKRNAAWDKAKGKTASKDDEEDPKAVKKPVRTTSNVYPSAASAARHGEREWIASMQESKERIELDDIRRGLKSIMAAATKVTDQKSYDAFLNSYGAHGDVVDRYINPDSIDSTADKLHYFQKDPDVQAFLRAHVVTGKPSVQEAKKLKPFKVTTPGWYVVDELDKAVEGPMQEKGAIERAKEIGGRYGHTYFSDYDIKRAKDEY